MKSTLNTTNRAPSEAKKNFSSLETKKYHNKRNRSKVTIRVSKPH